MFDIGANLCNSQFDKDLKEILLNANKNNISHILLTSTNHDSFLKNIDIIEKYSNLLILNTTYGLHPHNANHHVEFFKNFKNYIVHNKVKAIGEFGLDYFRNFSSRENQLQTMELFLEKALKYNNLPLFLHERDAFEDFYHLIKKSNSAGVVHCYTGNLSNMKKYLDLGLYIGVTGWISDKRRNEDLLAAVEYIPLDRLLIETDCPYLSPRNIVKNIRRNEPQYLSHIAQHISDIKQLPLQSIIEQTTKNALDLFLK